MVVNEDSGLDAHESNIGCGANVIMSGVGFEVPFYKPEIALFPQCFPLISLGFLSSLQFPWYFAWSSTVRSHNRDIAPTWPMLILLLEFLCTILFIKKC